MGYHINKIKKGTLGHFSKIREEYEELEDAYQQEHRVLEICELADLIGAIEAYSFGKFNLKIPDLYKMALSTKKAFKDGTRK